MKLVFDAGIGRRWCVGVLAHLSKGVFGAGDVLIEFVEFGVSCFCSEVDLAVVVFDCPLHEGVFHFFDLVVNDKLALIGDARLVGLGQEAVDAGKGVIPKIIQLLRNPNRIRQHHPGALVFGEDVTQSAQAFEGGRGGGCGAVAIAKVGKGWEELVFQGRGQFSGEDIPFGLFLVEEPVFEDVAAKVCGCEGVLGRIGGEGVGVDDAQLALACVFRGVLFVFVEFVLGERVQAVQEIEVRHFVGFGDGDGGGGGAAGAQVAVELFVFQGGGVFYLEFEQLAVGGDFVARPVQVAFSFFEGVEVAGA